MNITMNVDRGRVAPEPIVVEDPLAHDRAEDAVLAITRRGLCRIVCVAAEAAARFEREGIEHDPVAWMMTPLSLFGGRAGLDACGDRDAFTRAMLLHGLSLGLDAEAVDIDSLRDDDDDLDDGRDLALSVERAEPAYEKLYSATIDMDRGNAFLHGFHASTAPSIDMFRSRVAGIFGKEAMSSAVFCEGLNPKVGLVESLVAPDLLETLMAAQERGASNRNLAVTAERFVELDA